MMIHSIFWAPFICNIYFQKRLAPQINKTSNIIANQEAEFLPAVVMEAAILTGLLP